MSGEGVLPSQPTCRAPVSAELADVIAYLEQRRDNAAAIAARMADHDEMSLLACDRRRQVEIQIDELKAGLHHGSAEVRRALAEAAADIPTVQGVG